MICCKCKEDKLEIDFNWRNKSQNKRHHACAQCTKKEKKNFYEKNKKRLIREVTIRRNDITDQYKEYKSKLTCVHCNENAPECIDFHHIDATTKDANVSAMMGTGFSWSAVLKEIEKCIPVCKNCHAKIHSGRII